MGISGGAELSRKGGWIEAEATMEGKGGRPSGPGKGDEMSEPISGGDEISEKGGWIEAEATMDRRWWPWNTEPSSGGDEMSGKGGGIEATSTTTTTTFLWPW